MDAATKLENGTLSVRGCGLELSILYREFRVELGRIMVLEAKQICIRSIATSYVRHRHVTLLAVCHVVLYLLKLTGCSARRNPRARRKEKGAVLGAFQTTNYGVKFIYCIECP